MLRWGSFHCTLFTIEVFGSLFLGFAHAGTTAARLAVPCRLPEREIAASEHSTAPYRLLTGSRSCPCSPPVSHKPLTLNPVQVGNWFLLLSLQSTSGVKARAASNSPPSLGGSSGTVGAGGAADRAEKRFKNEAAAQQTPKKSGNEGFRV